MMEQLSVCMNLDKGALSKDATVIGVTAGKAEVAQPLEVHTCIADHVCHVGGMLVYILVFKQEQLSYA